VLSVSFVLFLFMGSFIFFGVTDALITYKANKIIRKTEQTLFECLYETASELFSFFLPLMLFFLSMLTVLIPIEEFFGLASQPFLVRFQFRLIVFTFITSNIARIFINVVGTQILRLSLKSRPIENKIVLELFSKIINNHNIANAKLYEFSSTKEKYANAIVTNVMTAKIFISDYFLQNISIDELEAIILHEIGHLKHQHIFKQQKRDFLWSLLTALVVITPILGLSTLAELYHGKIHEFIYYAMRNASFVLVPFGILLFFRNVFTTTYNSREHEKEADAFVIKHGVEPHVLISALKKLHYLNDEPESLSKYEEKLSTHPSLENRIKYINEFAESMGK